MITKAQLGIAPLTWSNDDKPEIGQENTFAQCISEMALAGYTGCELGRHFPSDISVLRSELELRKLKVATQWFSFEATLKATASVKKDFLSHLHKLRALGATVVGGGEFAHSIVSNENIPILSQPEERKILNPSEWRLFTSRIEELGKIAHEEGLTLCFHPHLGTCVQTAEESERLMNDCEPRYVSLNYDCGHTFCAGDDPVAFLKKLSSRIKHIHLKNVRPQVLDEVRTKRISFLQAVLAGIFTIPGDPEGAIDFPAIFKLLDQIAYDGWLIVEAEQDPAKAHPLKTALLARVYLTKHLGR